MRVKRKNGWSLLLLGVLFLIALCVFAGCTTTQTNNSTSSENPKLTAQQPEQVNPAPQSPAASVNQSSVQENVNTEITTPILYNQDFEMDHFGWSPQEGTIGNEENGNKYMMAGYTWGLYQFLQVKPGEIYQIGCKVKQGVGVPCPARMSVIFYDDEHNIMPESKSYYYSPGTGWSSFPKNTFKVPENALFTKLFLLSEGKGTVYFDDINVSLQQKQTAPAAAGTTK